MNRIAYIIFFILVIPMSSAFADELIFKNGDHLTGKLKTLVDGQITFETKAAGTVTVNIKDIETVSTDDPVEIHLTDGRVLNVKMGAIKGGFFAPESPEARTYSASDVVSINPPLVGPMPDTTGTVNANTTFEPGKVEKSSSDVNFDVKHKTKFGSVSAKTGVLYSEEKDRASLLKSTTTDSFYAVGKYDFCLNKKPFGYVSTRFDKDRIAKLDKRLTTGIGMEYYVVEKNNLKVKVNSNAEMLYEKYNETCETSDINAQLGYDVQKRFGRNWVLSHAVKYVPESRDLDDMFLSTNAELKAKLTQSLFWNLKVTMDYDSTSSECSNETDLKYMMGLQWKLF